MKRSNVEFARPHGVREFEFVQAGPDGAYWHAADGMIVRAAAAERGRAREGEVSDTSLTGCEMGRGRAGARPTGFVRAEKSYGRGGSACGRNAPGS
jgi:hypothetical protein